MNNIDTIFNTSSEGNLYSLFFMIFVFFLVFYFMIFRPQQKKEQEHKNLLKTIAVGDEIITTSGLIGYVNKVTKTGYILLELNDTTKVFIQTDFIASCLPKGTLKSLL